MPLDDLVGVIETLQQRIRDHGDSLRQNETRTRMALIDPMLTALGWDVSDPGLVTVEYNVSGLRADYALLGSDKPVATIEAKKLGESLVQHRRQMLTYSNEANIDFAGLTDGNQWELYDVFKRAELDDRRILEVNVAEEPSYQVALKMFCLWNPNLKSTQPIPISSPIVETAPAVTPLPPQPSPEPGPTSALPTQPNLLPCSGFRSYLSLGPLPPPRLDISG